MWRGMHCDEGLPGSKTMEEKVQQVVFEGGKGNLYDTQSSVIVARHPVEPEIAAKYCQGVGSWEESRIPTPLLPFPISLLSLLTVQGKQ